MADKLDPLNQFGQFVMHNLRDKPLEFYDMLAGGKWRAPALQDLQRELAELGESERSLVRRCVLRTLDRAVHDFLFGVQEASDSEDGVRVLVEGHDIAELSDGLQGEPYGAKGWQAKYSRFGVANETA